MMTPLTPSEESPITRTDSTYNLTYRNSINNRMMDNEIPGSKDRRSGKLQLFSFFSNLIASAKENHSIELLMVKISFFVMQL
jgi:hypothetical protein